MENIIKHSIESVSKMDKKARMIKLCELAVKQEHGTILPHEAIQLELIQTIRSKNGEIDKVLKNWAENPEYDPRLHIDDAQKYMTYKAKKIKQKVNKKPQPKIQYHKGFFTVNGEIRKVKR